MSRLDDELRLAFRRQEPAPDFVDRVLSRIAAPPVKKPGPWQRFLSLFQPPRVRWVALGFATALVVIIGSLQYQTVQQPDGSKEVVAKDTPPAVAPGNDEENRQPSVTAPAPAPEPVKPAPRRLNHSLRPANASSQLARKERLEQERREGEAAKERLMLALHIASTTLNEAQKIIRED